MLAVTATCSDLLHREIRCLLFFVGRGGDGVGEGGGGGGGVEYPLGLLGAGITVSSYLFIDIILRCQTLLHFLEICKSDFLMEMWNAYHV